MLAVPATHWLIERLPERVIRFMEAAFRVRGMAAVLLVNDLLAVYLTAFFAGLAGLLASIVALREESRLEILLAKPITPRLLVAARVWPVLASSGVAGVAVAATTAISIRRHVVAPDMVTATGALGGCLFLVALALVLLAALLPLLVRIRDGFHAFLVGSVVWLVPVLPSAVLIYRPDLFVDRELLRDAVVLASLVWHDAELAWIGPLALACAPLCCAGLVVVAGRGLARTGVA
jgi:hypothetical protein